jgi:hypothetical protein
MVNRRNLSAETEAPVARPAGCIAPEAEPVGRQRSSSYSRSRREAAWRPTDAGNRRGTAAAAELSCPLRARNTGTQRLLAVTNGLSDFGVDLRKRLIVVGSKSP